MEARPLGAGSVDRFISSTSSWSSGRITEFHVLEKLNTLVSVEIIWIFSNLDCFPY
jgi:hypothetical protein